MLYNKICGIENMKKVMDTFFDNADYLNYYKQPNANLYENDTGFMIELLTPGVKNEDISINYSNDLLTITVKGPKEAEKAENITVLKKERHAIDFERTYRLSDNADVEKIEAKLNNGILNVFIPKREEVKPKKIEVKVQ